jgi:hypothetical protein
MQTQTRITTILTALLVTAAAGCDKDDRSADDTTGGAAKPTASATPPAANPGAIDQLVPDGLELRFETATIDDELEAIVPVGWEASKVIPGRYRPAGGSDLGFMTSYKVGSNCDGYCSPKEWKPVVDKVEFGRLDGKTIEKDEKLPNGRLVVARSDDHVSVIAAWWKADASRYFYCRAELDRQATKAAAAFEAACRQARVIGW